MRTFLLLPISTILVLVPAISTAQNSRLHDKLMRIEHEADSLAREAVKLRDSLTEETQNLNDLFGKMSTKRLYSVPLPDLKRLQKLDSLHLNIPDQIEGKNMIVPFFDLTPDEKQQDDKMIRRVPAPKKKEKGTPVPNFPDWRMQKLNSNDMGSRL